MEYIKLKSALNILDSVMSDEGIKHKGKAIRKRLNELSAEDVEKVVRCNKCKHNATGQVEKGTIWCLNYHARRPLDGYCSYGERKEGADNE